MVRASALQLIDLRCIILVESNQKTLKMVSTAHLLGTLNLRIVVESKSANSLVVSWARHSTGRPYLYVEDRWSNFRSEKRVDGRKNIRR